MLPDPVDTPLNGTGEDYLGILDKTKKGPCLPWKDHEPQHNWAHNYCRNPKGNKKDKPWCYIGKDVWEYCDLPKVSAKKCKLAYIVILHIGELKVLSQRYF